MIVHFFEPPAFQAIGGLNLAIRSLEVFLKRSGIDVRNSSPIEKIGESGAEEVVHFHGLWQPGFPKISARCRRQNVPYIVSPHGMLEPWAFKHKWWKKWPYFHLVEKRHLAGAQRILATSENEARNLRRFFPASRCEVLPLGLATASKRPDYMAARSTLGWPDSEFIFLFLSRIHPKKGLHLLLAALAKLQSSQISGKRLAIVGGGEPSYVRRLKQFHESNRSRLPRIDWIGEVWTDEKWPYLQGADLFCLPSYSENFGLAVLEALQVGTRVLTTNQTPWSAIASWNAGYVVDPTEVAVGSVLAEHVMKSPPWSLQQRDLLAQQIHSTFSWDAIGPRYLQLYREIVKNNGS
jgi:glycosyltransferase involved in cell wall biosynthesis